MTSSAPLDYASPAAGRQPGVAGRFLLRPIGWPTHAATAALAAPFVCALLPPRGDVIFLIWTFLGALVVGGWWLMRGGARGATRSYFRQGLEPGKWWRWAAFPVALFALYLLAMTGVVPRIAFAISRPSMERLARAALAGNVKLPTTQRCGLYRVRISPLDCGPDGVYLELPNTGSINREGLFFRTSPAVPSTQPNGVFSSPYDGPWETVSDRFI